MSDTQEFKLEQTGRGFDIVKFKDTYGNECKLQKSSLATDDCIWLGANCTKLTIFEDEKHGKYITTPMPATFDVDSHMHLNRTQVIGLLPFLKLFAETGRLHETRDEEPENILLQLAQRDLLHLKVSEDQKVCSVSRDGKESECYMVKEELEALIYELTLLADKMIY